MRNSCDMYIFCGLTVFHITYVFIIIGIIADHFYAFFVQK